jgi:protein-tyrosine phosphatase
MPAGVFTVLFLCSGNYYRSRFAEMLFNHLASAAALPVRAASAGLHPRCWTRNAGPLSPHAIAGLHARGIPVPDAPRLPRDAMADDLRDATLVIAVKEAEHRRLVEAQFPALATRVRYWSIDDVQDAPPEGALDALEAAVRALLAEVADLTARTESTTP